MNSKKTLFASLLMSLIMILLVSCYAPSPLYGTWTDNQHNQITFMEDETFNAVLYTTAGIANNFSGTYKVLQNAMSFKIEDEDGNSSTKVSEWDIRGNMLYLTWPLDDAPGSQSLVLYKTSN